VCVCVYELKEIISNVKYQESVLRKILSDRGYHAHYLYIFLNGYVEPNETDFILRNF
jgi:NADH pyrophosphatase NudC (nudix superfamily)